MRTPQSATSLLLISGRSGAPSGRASRAVLSSGSRNERGRLARAAMDNNMEQATDLAPFDLVKEDFSTPLAVPPKRACLLLSIGMTRLYELLSSGELDSFHIGRARRI